METEAGSEGSYDTSLGSYDDASSSYCGVMGPSFVDPMDPSYLDQAGGYYAAGGQPEYWEYSSPVTPVSVTLSPQVVVTVIPAPATSISSSSAEDSPSSQPCCDHKTESFEVTIH